MSTVAANRHITVTLVALGFMVLLHTGVLNDLRKWVTTQTGGKSNDAQ